MISAIICSPIRGSGTIADVIELIARARELGLRVIG